MHCSRFVRTPTNSGDSSLSVDSRLESDSAVKVCVVEEPLTGPVSEDGIVLDFERLSKL